MALTLNAEQLKDVALTSGGGRYSKEAWKKYLVEKADEIEAAEAPIALGKTELDFPNVKPAHVRHMFRLILKDEKELAARIDIGLSKEHGVVIMPVTPVVEAEDEGADDSSEDAPAEGTTRRRRGQQAA